MVRADKQSLVIPLQFGKAEKLKRERTWRPSPVDPVANTDRDLRLQLQQCQQQLAASEARFRSIIDKNADAILVMDMKGTVCFANPSAENLFKCPKEQLMGQEVFGCLVSELPTCEFDKEIVAGNGDRDVVVVQSQVEISCQNGEKAIGEMRVVETEWDGDVAFIATLRDITARKKAEAELRSKNQQLQRTLSELQQTQAQLVQSEKMSSLGLLVAGVAHEINNPVNCIYGNISYANQYVDDLLHLLSLYAEHYPEPVEEIREEIEATELDFLMEDLPKLLTSMKVGADRICAIVKSLRNFARHDEAQKKSVDLHEGIDSTLLILQNRLKPKGSFPGIEIEKHYGALPKIDCHAGKLNQVFMNILANAIDALEEETRLGQLSQPRIQIRTELVNSQRVRICLSDNGPGIPAAAKKQLFDPFFTTKPVGKGTGLGLSISYQIVVEQHGGTLECISAPGEGTTFAIEIPIG